VEWSIARSPARPTRLALNTGTLRIRLGFLGIAAQSQGMWMEPRHEILQSVRGVALRINRNEQAPAPVRIGTQAPSSPRRVGPAWSGRYPDTRCIAKENYDQPCRLKSPSDTNLLPMMIAQRQLTPECGTGQIRVAKAPRLPGCRPPQGSEKMQKEFRFMENISELFRRG
jgi:hypothetical protein